MKHPLRSLLLLLITTTALAQHIPHETPKDFTQRFYRQVLGHPSIGPLEGHDLKLFTPFLSKELIRKMVDAKACEQDWSLHHHEEPGFPLKAPFSEDMTFTGSDDGGPRSFQIGSIVPQTDGSAFVNITFTFGEKSEKPWSTRSLVILKMQNDHYVVDDVEFFDENSATHLTEILAFNCNGPHFKW